MAGENTTISALTQSLQTAADNVSRTYAEYIRLNADYQNLIAYEAELTRQFNYHKANGDAPNAVVVLNQLQTVTGQRQNLGVQVEAARVAWEQAKANLETVKSQLSASEQAYIDSQIAAAAAQANAETNATQAAAQAIQTQTQAAKAAATTQEQRQKYINIAIIAGLGLLLIGIGIFVYKKYAKKSDK